MPLKDERESGILMPLFSLGGGHGIGDLGYESYRFARFLKAANQKYWQILPLVPVDEYGSPYKSSSSFAGEILYISLDLLVRDKLLLPEDLPDIPESKTVDYQTLRKIKTPLLLKAARAFNKNDRRYKDFLKENAFWINDYAVFCAAGGKLSAMKEGVKYRLTPDTEDFIYQNRDKTDFYKITQYFFYKQFFELKSYLKKLGIKLIGDLPFYVCADSSDVWSMPENFCLAEDFTPSLFSGVPPDFFSPYGQFWGNPIYDFDFQRNDGYSFWQKRFYHAFKMYDMVRIDHFRAFGRYYVISAEQSPQNGQYKEGIGQELFLSLKSLLAGKDIIAEDLGGEDDTAVISLINRFKIPNMKVLQFAFTKDENNPFLPKNYTENCVAYTGTHDNPTALCWYKSADKKQRAHLDALSGEPALSPPHKMIRLIMKSKAALCIVPLADYMCLGEEGRINTPGQRCGNWNFRISRLTLTDFLAKEIKELSKR